MRPCRGNLHDPVSVHELLLSIDCSVDIVEEKGKQHTTPQYNVIHHRLHEYMDALRSETISQGNHL